MESYSISIDSSGTVNVIVDGWHVPSDRISEVLAELFPQGGMDAAYDEFCSSEQCCMDDREDNKLESFLRYNPLAQFYDGVLYPANDELFCIDPADLRPDSVFTPDARNQRCFYYGDTRLGVLHALHLMYYDGWTISSILNLTNYYSVTLTHTGNRDSEVTVLINRRNGGVTFAAGIRSDGSALVDAIIILEGTP